MSDEELNRVIATCGPHVVSSGIRALREGRDKESKAGVKLIIAMRLWLKERGCPQPPWG